MMLKVDEARVIARLDCLESEIVNNSKNAIAEAREIGSMRGYGDETIDKLVDFLLTNEPRFDISAKQKEYDYLKQFCVEVAEVITDEATAVEA